jgi:outer membrane protein OmpA-like peptidoglycan-associated protein
MPPIKLIDCKLVSLVFATVFILASTDFVHAQTIDSQTIINALKPETEPSAPVRTRGLRNLRVEQTMEPELQKNATKFVSLTIGFKFDSSQITPESAATLSSLAKALLSEELRTLEFMIEGHTDAKGMPDYNLKLSQQRAAAVKTYLVQLGVDAQYLKSQGKGDSELINTQDRFAAENRRVKIITLTP